MTEYVRRAVAAAGDRAVAAAYTPGQPLDELIAVAREADPDASVVEVPEWGVALVRHLEVPDNHPMYVDYDVIEPGGVLVWSERAYVLYVTSAQDFEREFEPVS